MNVPFACPVALPWALWSDRRARLVRVHLTCSIPWERRFRRAWSGYSGRSSGPTSEQECRNIKQFRLPIDEEILIVCSWTLGGLDEMLEAIRTEPW